PRAPPATLFPYTTLVRSKGDPGNAAWQELVGINGIGSVVAEALVEFFAETHNNEAVDALLAEVTPLDEEPVGDVSSPVAGKTVVDRKSTRLNSSHVNISN